MPPFVVYTLFCAVPLSFFLALASGELLVRRWRLLVIDGPDAGDAAPLTSTPALVGAAPSADLRLTDDTVSRFHAEIDVGPERCLVRDLDSTNGVRRRGERLPRAEIGDGERIEVGSTLLELRAEDGDGRRALAERLGLPRLGPALRSALAARPGPVDPEGLLTGGDRAEPAHRRGLIRDLLDEAKEDVGAAARALGASPRTLFAELDRLEIALEE